VSRHEAFSETHDAPGPGSPWRGPDEAGMSVAAEIVTDPADGMAQDEAGDHSQPGTPDPAPSAPKSGGAGTALAPLSVGTILSRARQRRGIDLAEVEKATRISRDRIVAIEQNDVDRLPERAYVLGFIHTYAKFLGLDPEACLRRFKEEHVDREDPARQIYAAGADTLPLPPRVNLAGLTFVVLGIGLAFGWYLTTEDGYERVLSRFWENAVEVAALEASDKGADATVTDGRVLSPVPLSARPRTATPPSAPVSESASGYAGGPADGAQPLERQTLDGQALDGQALDGQKAAESGSLVQDHGTLTPVVYLAAEAAGEKANARASGQIYGAADGRIALVAGEAVWLRVEDTQDHLVFQETLAAGDEFRVPDGQTLLITVRDAGALSVVIDGQSLGAFGKRGEVILAQKLAPDTFLP